MTAILETNRAPLVSVGLPTYNRASKLRRAVESVLAQDYPNFELIISDNASPDGTQAMCEELSRRDSRIRYVRQPVNLGLAKNFEFVLAQARGEFFVWLSDDDWFDSSYLSQCAGALVAQAELGLACGTDKYYEDGKFVFENRRINLLEDSGSERVLSYYRQVGINGTFYGLMRREQLLRIPFQAALGGDWLLVARVAFLSKVKALESVAINRSVTGASQDLHQLAAREGLSPFMVRNPHLKVALLVFGDIVWEQSPYRAMSLAGRLALGCQCFLALCRRYCVPVWRERLYRRAKRVEANLKHAFRVAQ
ncbi:MAG TPA: glycosyltransferase family 2 protein [Pyrinomonadaceae bacterium]|jgi:glycosyltransferase involved in cell wall biosynthesis|nr:glycosyltransferase family 2 protein [Pyrinomonadaceae bacterium]